MRNACQFVIEGMVNDSAELIKELESFLADDRILHRLLDVSTYTKAASNRPLLLGNEPIEDLSSRDWWEGPEAGEDQHKVRQHARNFYPYFEAALMGNKLLDDGVVLAYSCEHATLCALPAPPSHTWLQLRAGQLNFTPKAKRTRTHTKHNLTAPESREAVITKEHSVTRAHAQVTPPPPPPPPPPLRPSPPRRAAAATTLRQATAAPV